MFLIKVKIIFFISLIFFFFLPFITYSKGKLELVNQLPAIKKTAETDSVQFIERLAAFYFHENINAYRTANNKGVLVWDDTLWLASRNHCVWMSANNLLSHDEKKGTYFFSGKEPGDRIIYVSSGKSRLSWSGENALYNYSSDGNNANEIAKNIADYSFVQWKNSPGHNENMLNNASYGHGVAFILSGGIVWATDLFMYGSFNYQEHAFTPPISKKIKVSQKFNPIDFSELIASNEKEKQSKINKSNSKNKQDVNTSKTISLAKMEKVVSSIVQKLFMDSLLKQNHVLQIAAQKHLNYLLASKSLSNEEQKGKRNFYATTPEHRVLKASHYLAWFKNKRTRIVEHASIIIMEKENFSSENILRQLTQELNDSRNLHGSAKATESAYTLKIKKDKERYVVYFVMLERMKK